MGLTKLYIYTGNPTVGTTPSKYCLLLSFKDLKDHGHGVHAVQLYSICTTKLNDECQCAYVYTANVNSFLSHFCSPWTIRTTTSLWPGLSVGTFLAVLLSS